MGNFVRLASDKDLEDYARLQEKADDLKWLLRAKVREQRIKAKIVKLEFTLNEALLVVNYSSDKHVNFRELLADITPHTKARIEFNAVGPRDQARMLGTLGVCGTGSCSSTWLQSFNAVGIRMARDQQLSLNPEKISGPCGRLMCCLQYEHDQYVELLAGLPRKGSRACHTESGTCGRVHKLHILKERVELKTDEGKIVDYPVAELDY
jgi:cell fate regulator YaaT (PSP1 superfamily)